MNRSSLQMIVLQRLQLLADGDADRVRLYESC